MRVVALVSLNVTPYSSYVQDLILLNSLTFIEKCPGSPFAFRRRHVTSVCVIFQHCDPFGLPRVLFVCLIAARANRTVQAI